MLYLDPQGRGVILIRLWNEQCFSKSNQEHWSRAIKVFYLGLIRGAAAKIRNAK